MEQRGTGGQGPGQLCIDTHLRTKTSDSLDMLCLVVSSHLNCPDLKQVSCSVDNVNEQEQAHATPSSTRPLTRPTLPTRRCQSRQLQPQELNTHVTDGYWQLRPRRGAVHVDVAGRYVCLGNME